MFGIRVYEYNRVSKAGGKDNDISGKAAAGHCSHALLCWRVLLVCEHEQRRGLAQVRIILGRAMPAINSTPALQP